MALVSSAVALAAEATGGEESSIPPWAFGAFAFAVLGALLVVTMMIKVDR